MQLKWSRISQGYRSDLADVSDAIRQGTTLGALVAENLATFIKYHRGIERALEIMRAPEAMLRDVHVYYGLTGSGKTLAVTDRHRDDVFIWGDIGDWFDGYRGESVILCDDVVYIPGESGKDGTLAGAKLSWWLRFLDRYPMRLKVKGSSCHHNAKAIYLTTNQDPKMDWWLSETKPRSDAFWRRVNRIKHF